ncbi:MAG: hypothetical protein V1933_04605 [Candidatus Omnitrophota bacterium]
MSFEQFKDKRNLWIECFSGEDHNSVCKQIDRILWNYAVFNIINKAREITPADAAGKILKFHEIMDTVYPTLEAYPLNIETSVEMNGILHRFMDECFFESQFLAVRRLIDAYKLADPKRPVFSLIALLNDMKDNILLMTRENFFKAEGLDYAGDRPEADLSIYASATGRHTQIDVLCGVIENNRRPYDTVRKEVFDYYTEKIQDASKKFKDYADKYLAHSATPKSRCQVDGTKIRLGCLSDAHKAICQVAHFIREILPDSRGVGLPPLCLDHFKFIDRPLVSTERVESLSAAWNEFVEEIDSWNSSAVCNY